MLQWKRETESHHPHTDTHKSKNLQELERVPSHTHAHTRALLSADSSREFSIHGEGGLSLVQL